MEYPQNIKVTVDAVVFSYSDTKLSVLLVKRKNEPFKGKWAIPGGFVEDDEPLEVAVARELEEETGVKTDRFEQLHTFGQPDRDPRGRTISVTYFTEISQENNQIKAASDAEEADWFPIDALPEMAFDHSSILKTAIDKFMAHKI